MTPPRQIDYRHKWRVMMAVGSGVFLATVDGSIINVSLPTLVRAFHTNFSVVQWVVLAYLLIITTSMLSIGRLADMVGKKTIYLLGFIIFTLGSVLCGTAQSVQWLIGCRVIQACGAAMIMALGAAIVTEAFPPRERGKAMGIIGTIVSMGIVLGPALGGLIIETLSWRWIFYVNLPAGIMGTLMVARNVPDYRPRGRQQFDYRGAAALFGSLFLIMMGLTMGQQRGFNLPWVWWLLGLGLLLLALFILIEQRVAQPMIDPGIFKNSLLSVSLATGFISFIGLGGTGILIPFYLENILQFKPIHVGLLMGIVPVMLGICAPISGSLSDRVGTRPLAILGLAVMCLGYLAASTFSADTGSWGYVIRIFAVGTGIGIFISPNNSSIMGTARRRHLGIVSGLMAETRTMGQIVGVSLLGAIWAGRTAYHAGTHLAGGATLAPVPAQISALNETFRVAAFLLGSALAMGVWALFKESRQPPTPRQAS